MDSWWWHICRTIIMSAGQTVTDAAMTMAGFGFFTSAFLVIFVSDNGYGRNHTTDAECFGQP